MARYQTERRQQAVRVAMRTGLLIAAVVVSSQFAPLGFGERRFVSQWSLPALGDESATRFDEVGVSSVQTPLFQRWLADLPQHVDLDAEVGQHWGVTAGECPRGYEIPGATKVIAVRCTIEQGRPVDVRQWRLGLQDLDPWKPWRSLYAGNSVALVAAESPGLNRPSGGHERATGALAVGTADGQLLRWTFSIGAARALPPARVDSAITALRFVSGHPLLASGDAKGTIQLWADGVEPATLPKAHNGPVYALEAFRLGRLVSAGFDGRLIVWDVNTRQKIAERAAHQGPIYRLITLRDGRLATAGHDGFVKVWSADVSTLIAERHLHYGPIYDLQEGSDGNDRLLTSAGWDGLVKDWFFLDPPSTSRTYFDARTQAVRVTAWLDGSARLWAVFSSIAVSPDGTTLAVNQNGWIRTWSLASTSSPQWPTLPAHAHKAGTAREDNDTELAFSRDGRWLAFPNLVPGRAINVETGEAQNGSLPRLVARTSSPVVVYAKELGKGSNVVVDERLVRSEIAGHYSDAAYIPARTWTDVLLGRVNVALVDMTGTTVIGYIQPRIPLALGWLVAGAVLIAGGTARRWRRGRTVRA